MILYMIVSIVTFFMLGSAWKAQGMSGFLMKYGFYILGITGSLYTLEMVVHSLLHLVR